MTYLTFSPKAGGEDWTADVSAELHRHNGYDVILFLDKVARTDDSGWMLELAINADGSVNGQITSDPGNDAIVCFDSARHGMKLYTDSGTIPSCVITADGEPPATMATLRKVLAEVNAIDKALDDPRGDGSGIDAESPTGDSYNELCSAIQPLFDMLGLAGPCSPPGDQEPKAGG